MKRHFNITVTGTVQGVFFRASAERIATTLALAGFVKNLDNGNVYCEAEGEEEMLCKFVDWCHHGPEKAVVKTVSVTEGDIKNYTGFRQER